MLALALLASHLVGDFVLQTRWQANGKLVDYKLRARHVAVYSLAFVPAVLLFWPGLWKATAFLLWLAIFHYATDSRRFRSTLGDVIAWRAADRRQRQRPRQPLENIRRADLLNRGLAEEPPRWPPANPWEPLPILIDQTLHIVQLAALGWFLT